MIITCLLSPDLTSQRQLVGLAVAALDFLILSTRLPLPSASTTEEIEAILSLLQKLMQVSTYAKNGRNLRCSKSNMLG